jgi:HSP20 family protein
VETAATVEVVVDVAGVPAGAVRVAIRRNSVLVVGVKLPVSTEPAVRFHLAERSYGRFARVIRLAGATDASRARATVERGQLRVVLPRLDDRRGRVFAIPVERG